MAFVIYPLSLAHATDWSGPRRALEISQGLLIAYSVGAALAPLLGAEAINLVGPEGLFYWFALVAALLAAFTVVRMIQRAPVPVEQQEHFVPVPQTTPVVAELDPRTPGPAS
ncbi:MAG TPA: MFS transporter, partial [Alphaproteobacteria bacterium]|nr:MFS transporter [Alphaproteobacteria bacterium]